jgi:beta-hydroxylase
MNIETLGASMERMIARWSVFGHQTFFDTSLFPWVADVEADWKAIRTELDAVLVHDENIPTLQDISPEQRVLVDRGKWKTFFLCGYGYWIHENCARCPKTVRVLRQIPQLKMAFFSVLAPRTHIPAHRGPYNGVLRYHLALMVPQPPTSCRIRVGDEVRLWKEGESLIFDDSYLHEVWNDSDSYRVVLFVDFLRPLPLALSWLNRLVIWRISKLPFITAAVQRARNTQPSASSDATVPV